jgi:DNA ligase D-like protein (predicted ligase)
MNDWRDDVSDDERGEIQKQTMPKWTKPMLATLTHKRFSSPQWIYERKLDGERCMVFRRKSRLHILSRNRKELNDTYPELLGPLTKQPAQHYIVDGEIVAFQGDVTSFSRLQKRIGISNPEEARNTGIKVYLYLFDVLYLDDCDVTKLALRTRKKLLRKNFDFHGALRFTAHRNECGEDFYNMACDKHWEGVIAKRADSSYVHCRSNLWLKFKCVNQQELVIGGYTDPQGARTGFGALLLGYYKNESFRYAGKVGTGFDEETLSDMSKKLKSRARKKCPFNHTPDDADSHTH